MSGIIFVCSFRLLGFVRGGQEGEPKTQTQPDRTEQAVCPESPFGGPTEGKGDRTANQGEMEREETRSEEAQGEPKGLDKTRGEVGWLKQGFGETQGENKQGAAERKEGRPTRVEEVKREIVWEDLGT